MRDRQIVVICQHFYPEMLSAGIFITELATGLAQSGYEVIVYCTQPMLAQDAKPAPSHMTYQNVDITRIPTIGNHNTLWQRGLFALSFLLGVLTKLFHNRQQIGSVIITTSPPIIGFTAWLFNLLTTIPYLTIVHDVYPDIATRLDVLKPWSIWTYVWEKCTQLILNRSQEIVVIGRDMGPVIKQKLVLESKPKLYYIPNWANPQRIRPIPRQENRFIRKHQLEDFFIVQYAGRLGRLHSLAPLIKAAERLIDKPILFQFIGDGAGRVALESMVSRLKLNNVQFLPYQPIDTLDHVLSAADIGVVRLDEDFTGLAVPSKSYGIMAAGTPILALVALESEIGQMVVETSCGIVLPYAHDEQIADAINDMLACPTYCKQMGRNGRLAFLQHYTLDHALDRYKPIIERQLAKNRISEPLASHPATSG